MAAEEPISSENQETRVLRSNSKRSQNKPNSESDLWNLAVGDIREKEDAGRSFQNIKQKWRKLKKVTPEKLNENCIFNRRRHLSELQNSPELKNRFTAFESSSQESDLSEKDDETFQANIVNRPLRSSSPKAVQGVNTTSTELPGIKVKNSEKYGTDSDFRAADKDSVLYSPSSSPVVQDKMITPECVEKIKERAMKDMTSPTNSQLHNQSNHQLNASFTANAAGLVLETADGSTILPPPAVPSLPAVGAAISTDWLHATIGNFCAQATAQYQFISSSIKEFNREQVRIHSRLESAEKRQEVTDRQIGELDNRIDIVENLARKGDTILLRQHGIVSKNIRDPKKRMECVKIFLYEALMLSGDDKLACRPVRTNFITPRNRKLMAGPTYQPTIRVFFSSNGIWDILCGEDINVGKKLKAWHEKPEVTSGQKPYFSASEDLSETQLQMMFFTKDVIKNCQEWCKDNNKISPKMLVTRSFGIREGEDKKSLITPYHKLKDRYSKFFPSRNQPNIRQEPARMEEN